MHFTGEDYEVQALEDLDRGQLRIGIGGPDVQVVDSEQRGSRSVGHDIDCTSGIRSRRVAPGPYHRSNG